MDTLIKRKDDIERFMDLGLYSEWMIIKSGKSIFDVNYWDPYDVLNYRRLLLIEMLDRCKRFELVPKLKFFF